MIGNDAQEWGGEPYPNHSIASHDGKQRGGDGAGESNPHHRISRWEMTARGWRGEPNPKEGNASRDREQRRDGAETVRRTK